MNDLLLHVLADDKKLITYRKEWNKYTGSVTATILLQQLIFHSSQKNYEPFYKFIEPCNNELYRVGDSWTEELGFTKNEFNTAYKKLANLGVVSKQINMNRVTYYKLNKSVLGKAIKSIYEEHITIEKLLIKYDAKGDSSVNTGCVSTKIDNVDLVYSKNKEQRILEEEEERNEILNLEYLDEFIDEYTNGRKTIKGSFMSYKNSVIDALKSSSHKNHKKTMTNFNSFVDNQRAMLRKKIIEPTKLNQLADIVEINMDDYVGQSFNGNYDDGIIQAIKQAGIDSYEVTYKGLGIRQSQLLIHVQVVKSKDFLEKV